MQTPTQNKIYALKMTNFNDYISQMNVYLQQNNIYSTAEIFTVTMYNESPVWRCEFQVQKFGSKVVSGVGLSPQKKDAKQQACKIVLKKLNHSDDPEVEELLIIGGVESNPGPVVKIPKMALNVQECDNNITCTTPYGLAIRVLKHQIEVDENHVILSVDHEIAKQIETAMNNKKKCSVLAVIRKEQIEPLYSNHIDFDPEKRIIYKVNHKIFDSLSLTFPLETTEGVFGKVGPFNLIPKNLLRVKIDKKWKTYDAINEQKYRYCLTSIAKQEMTKGQMVNYASLIAGLQMFYRPGGMSFAETISAYAYHFLDNITILKKMTRIVLTDEEAWDMLLQLEVVVVPIGEIFYGSNLELLKPIMDYPTESPKYDIITRIMTESKEVNYDQPSEDLIMAFLKGELKESPLEIRSIKFDFATEPNKIPVQLRSINTEFTEEERFLKDLVMARLVKENFEQAVAYALSKQVHHESVVKLLKIMSKRIYSVGITSNLQKMLYRNISRQFDLTELSGLHSVDFTYKNFGHEIMLARRMQLEYQVFAREFGISTSKNVFNSVETVKQLLVLRYSRVEVVNGDGVLEKVKQSYRDLKELISVAYDSKNTLKEINETWEKNKDSVASLLNKVGAGSQVVNMCDFSSFSSSLSSAKEVANALFDSALKAIFNIVGIPFENTFPASTALLYYLVWKNTNNSTLQYMLMLDILGTIGIVDMALAVLRTIGTLMGKIWDKVFNVSMTDAEIAELVDNLQQKTSDNYSRAQNNLADEDVTATASEDLSIWDKIMYAVNTNNIALIGLIAVGVATAFKLKSADYSYSIVGNNIVSTMKNISIVGGGLMMVPKVFQMGVSIFKWVVDELKGKVMKDHVTKYQLNLKAIDWLRSIGPFISDKCVRALPHSPDLCMQWLALEQEYVQLQERTSDLDREIRIEFAKQAKVFASRGERVHVALCNMFPAEEIFHVQFFSPPGYGKTDLAHGIIKELQDTHAIGQVKRAQTMTGPVARALISNAVLSNPVVMDKYNYNENLKFMDGYAGQLILYNDDCNVFSCTEPDKVIQQLYICSGNTVLANMADLSEKGRPIESKIMISNTNNPFPKIKDMFTPEALWRRRVLIQVELLPDIVKVEGKSTTDVINEYCQKNKLNRAQNEHLLFTFCVPDNNEITPSMVGGKQLVGLTYKQMRTILAKMYEVHMSSEWNRNIDKSPIMSKLQMYYKALVEKGHCNGDVRLSGPGLIKKGVEIVNKYYNTISKDRTQAALSKLDISPETKKEMMAKLDKDRSNDVEFLMDYNTPLKLDFLTPRMVSAKTTNHKLTFIQEKECFRYYLIPSKESNLYVLDDVKWGNIAKRKITVAGVEKEKYCYTSTTLLNESDCQLVLGALLEIITVTSIHRESYLERKISRSNAKPDEFSYMQDLRHYLTGVADLATRLSKWVYDKIINYVGKPLLNGVFVMFGLMGLFFSAAVVGELFSPSESSYNQNGRKIKVPGVSKPGSTVLPVSMDQSSIKNVTRSCFKAEINNTSFQLLAYSGNIFIAPRHAFNKVTFPTQIAVADPSTTAEIKEFHLLQNQVKEIPDTDYVLISLPKLRPVAPLRKKWITEDELGSDMINLRQVGASVISIRETNKKIATFEADRDFIIQGPETLYRPLDPRANGLHTARVLAADLKTMHGDSGSVVLHHSNHIPSTVLGIVHQSNIVMGVTYIAVLPREDIDKVMKQFSFEDKIEVCLHEVSELSSHSLKPVFKHNQIIKASPYRDQSVDKAWGFKRTPLFVKFPTDVQPAGQVADDARFPPNSRHFLEVSLNKSAGIKTVKMTPEEEKFAMSYLYSIYMTFVPEVATSRVLTTAQAITGIRMEGSTSIDVTTCAGLPYKEERGVTGKTPMIQFSTQDKTWRIQDRVFNDVEFYESMYVQGKIPQNFKLEFRKHELVGSNKILEPKTRTVGMGNFIQQIVYMKLFKDFQTFVKNAWMKDRTTPFAMGLNAEVHWDAVAQHLIYTDYVIDFDVKAWEEKMSQYLMNMAAKVKLRILKQSMKDQNLPWSDDYAKIAYALVVDYIHTDVVFEDLVYSKTSGLLSGHPGTFMENSEVHEMIFGVACYQILKKLAPQYATVQFIIEHCRSVKAADDIVIAISPLARQYVTVERLVAAYNKLGYEITAPDKTLVVSAKTIEEVQFLKNGFMLQDGIHSIYPNESQVNQLLGWVRTNTSNTIQDQMIINYGTAMRFAYHRGEDYYEALRDEVNSACAAQNIKFHWAMDYAEMATMIKHNHNEDKNKFWSTKSVDRTDELFEEEAVYYK
uniref:Nonstructural polyprotein n=1 Tax=Chipolycivirus sp. TaxID=2809300 RepID=A0AAU8JNM5_9VIRU